MKKMNVDICAIGAGSGGLSVASGAVQMGPAPSSLKNIKWGGDCLNYGCVPSKALLAAGNAVQAVRNSTHFGVQANILKIDPAGVYSHVRKTIAAIEPNDSVERFERLGVHIIQAMGQMTGKQLKKIGKIYSLNSLRTPHLRAQWDCEVSKNIDGCLLSDLTIVNCL